ncbi:MAG: nucleotidyltransferase domain-containing protein [Oscillospiraceae bacterium]|nr:nucleotidyltransferase domain-containing protein [Oscillospiraceae bacterium]
MNKRIYAVSEIKDIVAPIAEQYGAEKIFLFGSYAKGCATIDSDIDLRIDKGRIKGMFALSSLRIELLEKLGKNVDLLTTASLDSEFLDNIRDEEILIYG